MSQDKPGTDLRGTWESAAPGWAKWEYVFSAGLFDATEAMIEMAGIEPGMRVLDLACGAGSQTVQAARRVGPDGEVVAADISATMLDHVRRSAARESLQNIRTVECAAEDLDISMTPFDAAISRLGLMLFDSPSRALDAVRRVLRPGARFAALVFTTPANNAFMSQSMAILLRHAGRQPPGPGQPGIFALGGDGTLEGLMADRGLADVTTRIVRASLSVPDASLALQMMQQAFGAYRAVVADLGDEERARAWDEVRELLTRFETAQGFEAELEFVIGSGAEPA